MLTPERPLRRERGTDVPSRGEIDARWVREGEALTLEIAGTYGRGPPVQRAGRGRFGKRRKMTRIGIIVGSTRPGRHAESVARWVHEVARRFSDAEFEIVDIAEYHLPHLDEPIPPSVGEYAKDHTKAWAAKIRSLDGFVFVTPEYNHSFPGALKDAIDFVYAEWTNKAAGFVSYGSAGGVRAAEQLRAVMGELQIADVRAQVLLHLSEDFEEYRRFRPGAQRERALERLLAQVVSWSRAMEAVRAKPPPN